jgi:hypothetical protein
MDYDQLAMKQNNAMYLAWFRILEKNSPEELAATLASKHRSGKAVETEYLSKGSFNHCYKVKFEEGPDAVVRFPARGKVSFPKEKVDIEVSVMKYVFTTPQFLFHRSWELAIARWVLTLS